MEIGDKVKTIFGNIETVMNVEGSRVITFESACKNSWYHPTKIFSKCQPKNDPLRQPNFDPLVI